MSISVGRTGEVAPGAGAAGAWPARITVTNRRADAQVELERRLALRHVKGASDLADGQKTPLRRVVMASLIGTTIEWYDFFLYGSAAALVFNRLFFPSYDPLTGTLLAFATYALGFVARPVGGIVFGHYRRPDRAQAAADAQPRPDGRRDGADRPAAHLRADRRLGADRA